MNDLTISMDGLHGAGEHGLSAPSGRSIIPDDLSLRCFHTVNGRLPFNVNQAIVTSYYDW